MKPSTFKKLCLTAAVILGVMVPTLGYAGRTGRTGPRREQAIKTAQDDVLTFYGTSAENAHAWTYKQGSFRRNQRDGTLRLTLERDLENGGVAKDGKPHGTISRVRFHLREEGGTAKVTKARILKSVDY